MCSSAGKIAFSVIMAVVTPALNFFIDRDDLDFQRQALFSVRFIRFRRKEETWLNTREPSWPMSRRSRRPPKDPRFADEGGRSWPRTVYTYPNAARLRSRAQHRHPLVASNIAGLAIKTRNIRGSVKMIRRAAVLELSAITARGCLSCNGDGLGVMFTVDLKLAALATFAGPSDCYVRSKDDPPTPTCSFLSRFFHFPIS